MRLKFKKQKGVIIIIASLFLLFLLVLGSYFIVFNLTENRISRSQLVALQAYYLAEAGINEAIWRLKNDAAWSNNFITPPICENWSTDLIQNGTLLSEGSYQVRLENLACAYAQLIATSSLNFGQAKTAQRVIKIKAFRALGSLTGDSPLFTAGPSENMEISASAVNVYQGNIFSNNNLNIRDFSSVKVFDNPETEILEGRVLVGNNFNLSWGSKLQRTAICAKNQCQGDCSDVGCPPTNIAMPMVDFDSTNPNSYKNRAISLEQNNLCSILCNGVKCSQKCFLTETEFTNLLWQVGQNGTLTLNNEVTYIDGRINLKGGRTLVVNGVLVANQTVDIGDNWCWVKQGRMDCGFNQLIINDPGPGKPSGLLTKKNLTFGPFSSFQDIEITGLIYTLDEINFVSYPHSFNLIGCLLGRKISINSFWSGLNIFLDNNVINEGIWGGPNPPSGQETPYSPVITIEHWEEVY